MYECLSRSGAIAELWIETVPVQAVIMSPGASGSQASAACGDTGSGIGQGLLRLSHCPDLAGILEEEGNIRRPSTSFYIREPVNESMDPDALFAPYPVCEVHGTGDLLLQ